MKISERIRKIREYRALKQSTVAEAMNISQHAYSWLERESGNIKVDTLQKFCGVVKVELPFVVATGIPINEENIKVFDELHYSLMFDEYKKIAGKIEIYEGILFAKAEAIKLPVQQTQITAPVV